MRAHSGTGAGWALPRGWGAGTGAARDRRCGRRQHEMRCGTVWALRRRVAAFLQKGLAKNLQAPLWRGRVLQSEKENAGAKHIAHPQSPARVDAERCYLRPVRCKSAGGTGGMAATKGAGRSEGNTYGLRGGDDLPHARGLCRDVPGGAGRQSLHVRRRGGAQPL